MVRRSSTKSVEVVDIFAPKTLAESLTAASVEEPDSAPGVEIIPIIEIPPAVQPPRTPVRPVPENELTPEQRRIRDLENQLALERGKKDPEIEMAAPATPGAAENIRIHFLEDGLTFGGKVWVRGQELEFEANGPAYQDTCDRNGWSWLELRHNEFAQVDRYGKIMFRNGPWPGKTLLDAASVPYEPLKTLKGDGYIKPPSEDELAAAAKAEAQRGRAAPRLPMK